MGYTSTRMGSDIMVNIRTTKRKVLEFTIGRTGVATKASGTRENSTVWADISTPRQPLSSMDSGSWASVSNGLTRVKCS